MSEDFYEKLEKLNVGDFLSHTFISLSDRNRKSIHTSPVKSVLKRSYYRLSALFDQSELQDSVAARNLSLASQLAEILINEEGGIDQKALDESLQLLSENLYVIAPNCDLDNVRREHIFRVLKYLNNPEVKKQFLGISKPFANRRADELIRLCLGYEKNTTITDGDTRRVILSSWLTFLRQSVGSCFGTAPAILIHTLQPKQYLKDLEDLIQKGFLRRTYEGQEFTVPLCSSWGMGDLKRPVFFIKGMEKPIKDWPSSPGLLAGFEAAGFFDPSMSSTAKKELVYNVINKAIEDRFLTKDYWQTDLEGVLKKALMTHFEVSDDELLNFENRPQSMIASMGQPSRGSSSIDSYLTAFETIKEWFKLQVDHPLLRAWEYTIASFCESKSGFSRWNLYSSLGFEDNQPGGIADCISKALKSKIDHFEGVAKENGELAEMIEPFLRQLETRMRTSKNQQDVEWLRSDYRNKCTEYDNYIRNRNDANARAQRLAQLSTVLLNYYLEVFPNYFQEVYDPELNEIRTGYYDDSPAGFRLLYKHGRTSTSSWTRVTNPQEYSEALASFFIAIERDVVDLPHVQGVEDEISGITSDIVSHVRSQYFLETSLQRMAQAHGTPLVADPLKNLDKVQKKPWVYVSGGTMDTLICSYCNMRQKPRDKSRWVESPLELMVFLADLVKHADAKSQAGFHSDPAIGMLMHSPTHAFIFQPGHHSFKKLWESDIFTLSYARSYIITPYRQTLFKQRLTFDQTNTLRKLVMSQVPDNFKARFVQVFTDIPKGLNPTQFRSHFYRESCRDRGLMYRGQPVVNMDQIDSLLYSTIPFTPRQDLEGLLKRVLEPSFESLNLPVKDLKTTIERFAKPVDEPSIAKNHFLSLAKAIVAYTLEDTFYHKNVEEVLLEQMYKKDAAINPPILFADSNWTKDYFSFLVNPGTGELDFWRTNHLGTHGFPMSMWENWLDGSDRSRDWGVYFEYLKYLFF